MRHCFSGLLTVWTITAALAAPPPYQVQVLHPEPNAELEMGSKVVIEATLSPKPSKGVRVFMTAVFSSGEEVIDRVPLYDDGDPDHYDREAGDGIYSNAYTPRRAQTVTLRVRAYWDDKEQWSAPVPLSVKQPTQPTKPTRPIQPTQPIQPTKPTKPLGGILTVLGLLLLAGSVFTLRRTVQPQGGLGVELRLVGKREALLVGPKGTGDITVADARFTDLKLAKVRWDGLNGLLVQPLQAKSAWVEETKGQRLRDGLNRIKVSHTVQGVPVSGEVTVKIDRFVDENRVAVGLAAVGIIAFLLGIVLLSV